MQTAVVRDALFRRRAGLLWLLATVTGGWALTYVRGRLYIPDFGSHRIQVYKKDADPLGPDDIWPEPKAPFLYNV